MDAPIQVEMKFHVGDTGHNPFGEDNWEMQGLE